MNIELSHKGISKTNPAKVVLSIISDGKPLIADNVDLSKESKRTEFVKKTVDKFPGIDADDLSEKLLVLANELLSSSEDDDVDEPELETPLVLAEKALAETDSDLVDAATDFLKKPNLISFILRHIADMGVVRETALVLALYLVITSRLLLRPLAAVVNGTSSSGKSHGINVVSMLFPPESLFKAHKLTPSALQYLPPGSLIHRAVIAGERSRNTDDGQAEATRALREMISDGILRIAVCGKDESGNLTTHHIEQPGPIAYVESTTLGSGEVFEEDKTRFLFLCVDESESQSKAVLQRMAADATEPRHQEDIESLVALHHTMQRLLRPKEVIIPYAADLIDAIPCRRPESRRAFGHLLNLICASVVLHQYQRETDGAGRVVADVADYEIVRTYLSDAIGRGLGVTMSAGAESLWDVIEEHFTIGDKFTVNDVKEKTGLGKVVYDRMRELRQHGYVKIAEPGAGSVAAKYELNPIPDGASGLELPALEKSVISVLGGKEETNV